MGNFFERKVRFVFISVLFSGIAANAQSGVEKLYAQVESRQLQAGKLVMLKSEVCYEQNGNMVTHFISPKEYMILTNKTGEIKFYDPALNSIYSNQNASYSSQTSQFYYFLSGKANDMGLGNLGFIPLKTYVEKGLIVTLWGLKVPNKNAPVQQIKIVHQNQNPIYMDYKDGLNKIIRKVYYYTYVQLQQFGFPSTSTEIIYNGPNDSTVTKTVYKDIKLNNEAISYLFGYKIPANAKIIK